MSSSSEDVDMKPEITGNVYEYVDPPTYSFLVSLEEGVLKKVTANDYEWNMHYAILHGSKVQITAKFLSRYAFEDKVILIVNAEHGGHNITKEFELIKKMNEEQDMELDLIKQEEGSNADINVTFELVIKDMDYIGYNIDASCALKSPRRPHDAILIAGQEKFYVQKKYLATWSKFFDEMFFGEFVEEDAKKFTLDADLDPKELLVLLKIIHPDQTEEINDSNVEFLLKLSFYFKIPSVLVMTVNYLTDFAHCPHLSVMDRLELSDKYKLAPLQVAAMKEYHKMDASQQRAFSDENRDRIREFNAITMRNFI